MCREGTQTVLERFSLTFLRLRGLVVLVHPGKLEYFLKTNGWKMYFPIEAVPF